MPKWTVEQSRQVFASLMRLSQVRPLTIREKSQLSYARQQLRADRKGGRRNPSQLDQLTDSRLREIADFVGSGVTQLTGRAIVDEEGRVIGRHGGGFFKMFPELAGTSRRPGEIAKAIERGQGKVYDQVRGWVREGMADYVPAPRRRSPEAPSVLPHKQLTRRCRRCGVPHGKGEHRFHGKGAFHRTHLWGFPKLPPLNRRRRNPAELCRTCGRPAGSPYRAFDKTGRIERGCVDAIHTGQVYGESARFHNSAFARKARKAAERYRRVTKSNPRSAGRPIRMGTLEEIRYNRDHGRQPGYYRHPFKVHPTIYYLPKTNDIEIRGGW